MPQEVKIKKTLLPAPTIDAPDRKVFMIEYRAGELPPRFLYLSETEYTEEKLKELIKKDIARRMAAPEETISI